MPEKRIECAFLERVLGVLGDVLCLRLHWFNLGLLPPVFKDESQRKKQADAANP